MALTVLAGISRAEGPAAHPDFGDSPTPVNILIVILDLDEVKTADQSFVANVFLEYRWQDPRLAHQDETDRVRPLHDVWNPRLLLINQQRVSKAHPQALVSKPQTEFVHIKDRPAGHLDGRVTHVLSPRLIPGTPPETGDAASFAAGASHIT